jgi:hypothetical protein
MRFVTWLCFLHSAAAFRTGIFPSRHLTFSSLSPSRALIARSHALLSSTRRIGKHGLHCCSTSKNAQWDLFVKNYAGNWVGTTTWYDRDDSGNRINLDRAAEAIESRYNISFLDPDNGIWEGSGLRYSNGTRTLPLSRATYNAQGSVWQFPGVGGLGSLVADENTNKSMQEVYFFHENNGAMILVIFEKEKTDKGCLVLKSVGTLPFTKQAGAQAQIKTTSNKRNLREILDFVSGWRGSRMSFSPQTPPSEQAVDCGMFDQSPFLSSTFTASLEGGLVLAVPDIIDTVSRPFEMRFGCLQSSELFKQVTISFDAAGRLAQWTYDAYSPPPAR